MDKQHRFTIILAVILVLAAAISRVLMYPDNFSPVIGMAIFSGAVIKDRKMAFMLPLMAMFLSDLMFEVFNIAVGFWGWGQLVGYGILAMITLVAFNLKKINLINVAGYSIASSLLFFLLSNLSFFLIDNPIYHTYPQNTGGLLQCYIQALPFLRISFIADLVYSGILFGTYYLVTEYAIRKRTVALNHKS